MFEKLDRNVKMAKKLFSLLGCKSIFWRLRVFIEVTEHQTQKQCFTAFSGWKFQTTSNLPPRSLLSVLRNVLLHL